jgi:hypothetical protein
VTQTLSLHMGSNMGSIVDDDSDCFDDQDWTYGIDLND